MVGEGKREGFHCNGLKGSMERKGGGLGDLSSPNSSNTNKTTFVTCYFCPYYGLIKIKFLPLKKILANVILFVLCSERECYTPFQSQEEYSTMSAVFELNATLAV